MTCTLYIVCAIIIEKNEAKTETLKNKILKTILKLFTVEKTVKNFKDDIRGKSRDPH